MNCFSKIEVANFKLLQVHPWLKSGLNHGFFLGPPDLRNGLEEWNKAFPNTQLRLHKQTHSSLIIDIEPFNKQILRAEADAWFQPQVVPQLKEIHKLDKVFGVLSADCTPVIIFSEQELKAAVLHCGWRGTASGLLPLAIGKFDDPTRCQVAIGPAAGVCCYEVQVSFVVKNFSSWQNDPEIFVEGKLSMSRVLELQALKAGVSNNAIFKSGICTICSQDGFSYRRQGEVSGRQLSFIGF